MSDRTLPILGGVWYNEVSSGARSHTMNWHDRITINPEILTGKPVVKGTRLAVEFIIDLLAQGWTEEEILRNYPGLTSEDIRACLIYASNILKAERVYPLTPAET
jgi:uncharacterized protein (DUF433 family)